MSSLLKQSCNFTFHFHLIEEEMDAQKGYIWDLPKAKKLDGRAECMKGF